METIVIIEATTGIYESKLTFEEIKAKENPKTYSLQNTSNILYKKLVYKEELEKLDTNPWRARLISLKPKEEAFKDWDKLMSKYIEEQQRELDKLKEVIKIKE